MVTISIVMNPTLESECHKVQKPASLRVIMENMEIKCIIYWFNILPTTHTLFVKRKMCSRNYIPSPRARNYPTNILELLPAVNQAGVSPDNLNLQMWRTVKFRCHVDTFIKGFLTNEADLRVRSFGSCGCELNIVQGCDGRYTFVWIMCCCN